jgi:hypothetical protein
MSEYEGSICAGTSLNPRGPISHFSEAPHTTRHADDARQHARAAPNAIRFASGSQSELSVSLTSRDEADPFGPVLPFIPLLAHICELGLQQNNSLHQFLNMRLKDRNVACGLLLFLHFGISHQSDTQAASLCTKSGCSVTIIGNDWGGWAGNYHLA